MSVQVDLERLKECREAVGLSKRETSKRIRVSQPAYVRYEGGTRTPSIQVLTSIASVFNTSVSYLTGESDLKDPDFVMIDKNTSPELFAIFESCKNYDENQLKRLLDFCKKL